MIVAVVLGAGSLALVAGCGGSGEGPGDTGTTLGAVTATTPSTAASTTTTASTSTTSSGGGTTSSSTVNTLPALVPGQPCTPGSSPDCIDPEGTGQYVYLIGGAACMASPIGGAMCTDLDGDGNAGYPDAG